MVHPTWLKPLATAHGLTPGPSPPGTTFEDAKGEGALWDDGALILSRPWLLGTGPTFWLGTRGEPPQGLGPRMFLESPRRFDARFRMHSLDPAGTRRVLEPPIRSALLLLARRRSVGGWLGRRAGITLSADSSGVCLKLSDTTLEESTAAAGWSLLESVATTGREVLEVLLRLPRVQVLHDHGRTAARTPACPGVDFTAWAAMGDRPFTGLAVCATLHRAGHGAQFRITVSDAGRVDRKGLALAWPTAAPELLLTCGPCVLEGAGHEIRATWQAAHATPERLVAGGQLVALLRDVPPLAAQPPDCCG